MLYDNGGMGGRPPSMPAYRPPAAPQTTNYQNQALFNLGQMDRRHPAYHQLQQAQGQSHQNPMEQAGSWNTAFSQPQMSLYSQQMRPQYQFGGAGGMTGGGMQAMGYRRRRPMYARDINGRLPEQWGYQQQPQYDRPPMQLR
jgi:hypothetical protein